MGQPVAETLQRKYDEAVQNANGDGPSVVDGGVKKKVEVLPTLDAHGRLYDVGHGKGDGETMPGNCKKKEKFKTRDLKTGDIIRYNADDDTTTLGEILQQERFSAVPQNDLDYTDDNAEKLGRQKVRSDAMKRQFAIHDYKRTQKAMATSSATMTPRRKLQ